MKGSVVIAILATLASAVSAHTEHAFPLRSRHSRRAGHKHLHKKHNDLPAVKRSSQCPFPTDCGLVAVTPNQQNAGWAMSPNQPCLPGNYCPYACPSGQVSMQWDPAATSYTYPLSMHGGMYCNADGTMSKPLPNNPFCQEGVGTFIAVNEASEGVAFCQTVLPGNEAMLIPTEVGANSQAVLAVPDTTYWASTSAEYFINAPGVSTAEGCVWGSAAEPVGNWSPFVCGANQAADGATFVTAGINPIYCCEPANGYSQRDPGFAIKIECPNGGCTGLPCQCDPSTMGVNKCSGGAVGAGGAEFCVVTVAKGYSANIVVYSTGAGSESSGNTTVVNTVPAVVPAPATSSAWSSSSSTSSKAPPPPSSPLPPSPPPPPSSTYVPASSYASHAAPARHSSKVPSVIPIASWYPSPVSSAPEIEISPSTVPFAYHQGGISTNSTVAPLAVVSATPGNTATSNAFRATLPITTLLALALVALGMVNM